MRKRIRKFKLSQLKDLARTMLLRIAGKKADLIERIEEHIENGVRYDDKIKLLVIGVIIKKILLHESIPSYTSLYNAIRFGGPNANLLAQLQQDTRNISARPDSEALSNMAPVPQMPRTKSADVSTAYTHNAVYFKPSPFYSLKQLILGSPQIAYASQARSVARLDFVLSDDDNRIFRSKPGKMQVLLLCGAFEVGVPVTQSANIEFPIPLEIYVNGAQLKENVKGIKGKPGTARPANITKLISRSPSLNKIEMVYAGSKKHYLLYCFIAETRTSEEIADEVFHGQHIHLLSTIDKIKEEYTHGDDDLEVATSSLSLKCPLTYSRMKFPAKSIYCQHIQCFDCLSFLQLQEQIPTWTCPICSRKVELEELAISDYYLEILLNVNDDVESVTLQPDGSWLANVESPMESSSSPSPKPKFVAEEAIEIVSIDSESEDETPQPPPRPLVETIDTPLPELVSAAVSQPQTREQFTAEWNRNTTPLTSSVIGLDPDYEEGQEAAQSQTQLQTESVPQQNEGASEVTMDAPENQDSSQNQDSLLQNQNSSPQNQDLSRLQVQDTQLQTMNAQPAQLETPQAQSQSPQLQNQNTQLQSQTARSQTQSPQLQYQNTQLHNRHTQVQHQDVTQGQTQNAQLVNQDVAQVQGENVTQLTQLQGQSTQLQNRNGTQLQSQNVTQLPHLITSQVERNVSQLPSHGALLQTQSVSQSHNQPPPLQSPASPLQSLSVSQLQSSLSSPYTLNGERTSTAAPAQKSLPAMNTFGPLPFGTQQNATSSHQRSRPIPELLPGLNGHATQVPQRNPSVSKVPLPPLRANSATGTLPGLSTFSFEPSTPRPQDYLDVRNSEQNLTSMFRIKRAMTTQQEQVLNRKDLQERHEQLRANFQNNLRQNIETNGNLRPTEVSDTTDPAPEVPEYQRPGLTYSRSAFDLLAASREDSRPLPKKTKTINGQSPVGTNLSPLNGQIEDFTLQTPQLNQPPMERTWNKRLHSEEKSPSPTK